MGEEEYECVFCFEHIAFCHTVHACSHSFCYKCLIDWLKSGHTECPSCRKDLFDLGQETARLTAAHEKLDTLLSHRLYKRPVYSLEHCTARPVAAVRPRTLEQRTQAFLNLVTGQLRAKSEEEGERAYQVPLSFFHPFMSHVLVIDNVIEVYKKRMCVCIALLLTYSLCSLRS